MQTQCGNSTLTFAQMPTPARACKRWALTGFYRVFAGVFTAPEYRMRGWAWHCAKITPGNKKGLESQGLFSNLWCPGETRTKRYMLRFLWGGVLCGFLSTHKSTHYFFCAYQNADFGDAQKRLPPSFGGRQSADFLPSPSLAASGAVWTGFRFRFCVGLRPVFAKPPGPPGTGSGQRMKHSYIVRRRGPNYPQGATPPGVPFGVGPGHEK